MAAELVGRFIADRPALAAIALTTDTSALTAIANDYGYDDVFSRQVGPGPGKYGRCINCYFHFRIEPQCAGCR
ncbi:MAG: hypothetical protein CM15mP125_3710 [Gammaproteobacteria bacterium]|nr:MAG: hypothetical protein CM15mP125_3710 [Gammaproteobacteria bacterium]